MFKKILAVLLSVLMASGIFTTAYAHSSIVDRVTDTSLFSYRYDANDDYWYTDKDEAWQRLFGYSAIYDLAAPFVGLEYDYVRVHFEYEGKDWLVQLWKGQYGAFFYGCEAGIYNKPHLIDSELSLSFYRCAKEDERLLMQTNLYRKYPNGSVTREFSSPEEKTWWSTGFKTGHLSQVEPASELLQTGKIIFDTPEMAAAFAGGLKECGFWESRSKELSADTYNLDGNTVLYSWQNISEAENTMEIKTSAAFAVVSLAVVAAAITFDLLMLGLVYLSSYGIA